MRRNFFLKILDFSARQTQLKEVNNGGKRCEKPQQGSAREMPRATGKTRNKE